MRVPCLDFCPQPATRPLCKLQMCLCMSHVCVVCVVCTSGHTWTTLHMHLHVPIFMTVCLCPHDSRPRPPFPPSERIHWLASRPAGTSAMAMPTHTHTPTERGSKTSREVTSHSTRTTHFLSHTPPRRLHRETNTRSRLLLWALRLAELHAAGQGQATPGPAQPQTAQAPGCHQTEDTQAGTKGDPRTRPIPFQFRQQQENARREV